MNRKMGDWASLPPELRLAILELLTQHRVLASYATVSKEWQAFIERQNFRRLRISQSCLDKFERLVQRQRGLVKHIWLNIELRRYTCRCCQYAESETWIQMNNRIIRQAVSRLFSILSTWSPPKGHAPGLVLELNAYSRSDSEHWFKNCYFGAPDEDDLDILGFNHHLPEIHDPKHGWENGQQLSIPMDSAIRRPFEEITFEFPNDLPRVEAVTTFVLRRQCRRQWAPPTLSYLWRKLPRLTNIIYEPWQLCNKVIQDVDWDNGKCPWRLRIFCVQN